eukprot:TRINITY_DN5596_c0_g1_i2.p1 TRINITY_DN5596_c0_g1~~TRINITY_DN5596_c0_g1_i2.p1  ORF type:complete len:298 (+),score=78.34 TRINITY_DN5596_c0_g1_i2:99-992(+)
MIRRPPRSTLSSSSAASDVYKRQVSTQSTGVIGATMPSHTAPSASHPYLTSALYLHKLPNGMLWDAAAAGDQHNVKRALGGRAGVNSTDPNSCGETALHKAAAGGHSQTVAQLLIAKADCNALDRMHSASPLHLAAAAGHASVVGQLVRHGSDLYLADRSGETALHCAAAAGHSSVFEALSQVEPLLDAKNAAGYTPLMKAAQNGHVNVVTCLIQAGADVTVTDNKYGWTALHVAAVDGRADAAEALIKAGANPSQKDAGRCTALQVASTPETRLVMSRAAAELEMQRICAKGPAYL